MTKRKGSAKKSIKKTAPKKKKTISPKRRKKINLLISQKAKLRFIDKKIKAVEENKTLSAKEKKTALNKLLNEGVQANTILVETNEYLNKFREKKKHPEFRNIEKDPNKLNVVTGKVWEKAATEDFIFGSNVVGSVNGLKINSQDSEILDLLNKAYRQMGSNDYIQLQIDKNGNAILSIINGNELDDDDFEENLFV